MLFRSGIAAALGTGIGGISTSAHFYYKLSQELNEDMEQVVESFVLVQRQISSLASVALQNRQALDLLTTEKRGACLFPREDCCYFITLLWQANKFVALVTLKFYMHLCDWLMTAFFTREVNPSKQGSCF